MPAPNTITSADSVVLLTIDTLYDDAQTLQGYMADRAFETDAVDVAELVRGVDGILSAGWVPYTPRVTLSIMPDSLSAPIFENWVEAERSQRAKLIAQMQIDIPSTRRRYTCTNGYLASIVAIPAALRVLQGRPYIIAFDTISAGPM